MDIFEILIAARRPLTIHEMREALSVTPGDTTWNPSKLLNDIYSALTACGCLVAIEEEELTIHTVHPSVDEFLFDFGCTLNSAQTRMNSIIVTYLSYGVFETQLTTRLPVLEVGPAPLRVVDSMARPGNLMQSLASKLLRARRQPNFDASKFITDSLEHNRLDGSEMFHFHCYAKQYVLSHLLEYPKVVSDSSGTLSQFLMDNKLRVSTMEDMWSLAWISMQQPDECHDFCTQRYYRKFNFSYHDRSHLFYHAIEGGLTQAISRSLDLCQYEQKAAREAAQWSNDNVVTKGSLIGCRPLQHAVNENQIEMVNLLITSDLIEIGALRESIGVAVRLQNDAALEAILFSQRWLRRYEIKSLLNDASRLGGVQSRTYQLLRDYATAYCSPVRSLSSGRISLSSSEDDSDSSTSAFTY
jgi:hypothetical protein